MSALVCSMRTAQSGKKIHTHSTDHTNAFLIAPAAFNGSGGKPVKSLWFEYRQHHKCPAKGNPPNSKNNSTAKTSIHCTYAEACFRV